MGDQRRRGSCGTSIPWSSGCAFVAMAQWLASLLAFPWTVWSALFCCHLLWPSRAARARSVDQWFSWWTPKKPSRTMVMATHGSGACSPFHGPLGALSFGDMSLWHRVYFAGTIYGGGFVDVWPRERHIQWSWRRAVARSGMTAAHLPKRLERSFLLL